MNEFVAPRFADVRFSTGERAILKPGAWHLARFIGESWDPDYLVARPYKVLTVPAPANTTALARASLSRDGKAHSLVHTSTHAQSRFEVGPEMTAAEVLDWLLKEQCVSQAAA